MTDISRLQVQLQVTKLQNKDNPLYQLLHGMIGALKDTSNEVKTVVGSSSSGSSTINNITNNNYSLVPSSGIGSGNGLSATSHPMLSVVNKISPVANNIIQFGISGGSIGLSAISLSFLSPSSQSSGGGGVTGSGTTGKIAKFTGASAIGDSVIVESVGNIGIGLTPTAILDINGIAPILGRTTNVLNNLVALRMSASTSAAFGDTTGIGEISAIVTQVITLKSDLIFRVNIGDSVDEAGRFTSTKALQWGGGAAISSSGDVAQLGLTNIFTAEQVINTAAASNSLTFKVAGVAKGYVGLSGRFEGDTSTDIMLAAELGGGVRFYTNGSAIEKLILSAAGILTVNSSSFADHNFTASGNGETLLRVRNESTGASASAGFYVGNDISPNLGQYYALGSGVGTSGINVPNGVGFAATGAGGLSLAATHASGAIRFYAGGTTEAFRINPSGILQWAVTASNAIAQTGTPSASVLYGNASATMCEPPVWIPIVIGSTGYRIPAYAIT